jgi:hypothetical protein
MTGYQAPPSSGGLPDGPPWPLDLLADLHAGALDDEVAAELRARIADDPQARATLAALDATRADLRNLPPLQVPPPVAARIDAALSAEAAAAHPAPALQTPQVTDLATERRRRRGLLAGAGLLAAAAAAVGVIAVANLTGGQTSGAPQAAATASDQPLPPLPLDNATLGAALDDAMARHDYGPLGAAGRLQACLGANAIDPAGEPLGAREVTLNNRPGVLLVLPTGTAARFRLVVVPPDCGPARPGLLAETIVGR